MSKFKLNQKVFVKEIQRTGRIYEMKGNKPTKVKLDNGTIINVVNLSLEIISLIKVIISLIKALFRK